ncbi:MAG: tRNA (adenosine(37)-N6)-dimethylallyltransferase MiaA [Phycisphaerales bacterium]
MCAIPVIVGPTAGGKTALAVELALLLRDRGTPAEVVTADAFQVYRRMDVGTAKPTESERRGVPHHLLDLVEPTEAFTVHDWLKRADALVADLQTRGVVPIVVGGTNLYVRAFLDGLFEGPEPDEAIRDELRALGLPAMRAELERVDPAAAARIDPADERRTVRALEVHRQTGTPISDLQQQWEDGRGSGRPGAVLVGLEWPTEAINARINARVRGMVERGLVAEARGLHEGGHLGPQAGQALGYKQLVEHFEGRSSLDDALERIKIETRRFAKNQRTWLKRFRARAGSSWFDAAGRDSAEIAQDALQKLLM